MAAVMPSQDPVLVAPIPWLLGPRRDLAFYLGSCLAGWAIVAIALLAAWAFPDALGHRLRVGPFVFSVWLAVWTIWHFLLDIPHGWGTYARTLLDPDERARRKGLLILSCGWFLVGPALLAGTQLAIAGGYALPSARGKVFIDFMLLVQLWTYHHVVRQHWGMLALYRRKAGETTGARVDRWAFDALVYLPLVWFITGGVFQAAGYPSHWQHVPVLAGFSVADVVQPASVSIFVGTVLAYGLYQWHLGARRRNVPKLLLLAGIVPLHVAAFAHPLLATLAGPIVVIGHNIQYLCLVYHYGQARYAKRPERRYRWARLAFRGLPLFMLCALAYVYVFRLGPWVDWIGLRALRGLVEGLLWVPELTQEVARQCARQMIATFMAGFVMQHYFLDSFIWRVREDDEMRRILLTMPDVAS
ncbi:MAG: hypothetical protein JWM80_1414 [Cyanobacteria bacterium RYN_339]|nr:hypothetical protein [Cyanobacteria bacterium RYN_339]